MSRTSRAIISCDIGAAGTDDDRRGASARRRGRRSGSTRSRLARREQAPPAGAIPPGLAPASRRRLRVEVAVLGAEHDRGDAIEGRHGRRGERHGSERVHPGRLGKRVLVEHGRGRGTGGNGREQCGREGREHESSFRGVHRSTLPVVIGPRQCTCLGVGLAYHRCGPIGGVSVASGGGGRLAFVTPRYGDGVVGGAETAIAEAARGLAARGYDVELLTTCATSHVSWANVHEPGTFVEAGRKGTAALPHCGRCLASSPRNWRPRCSAVSISAPTTKLACG